MKSEIVLVSVILMALTAPLVHAANGGGGGVYHDDEDVTVSWTWTTSAAGGAVTYQLRRFADLNNDGDFADTGENTAVTSACGAIVTCLTTTDAHGDPANVLTFKNGSSDHRPGNYSIRSVLTNGIGSIVDSYSFGFRILPTVSQIINVEVISQAEGTRTLVNETKQELQVDLTGIRANMSFDNLVGIAGQNVSWTFHSAEKITPSAHTLTFSRLKDLNDDGDYLDAGETVTVASRVNSGSATCAGLSMFSCRLDYTRQSATFTFKGQSNENVVGEYFFDFRWLSAVGNEVAREEIGLTLESPYAPKEQHEQTRALINATSGSGGADFPYTWNLINTSYVNATQNISSVRSLINVSYANVTQNLTIHNITTHEHIDVHNVTQNHGGGGGGGCDDDCQDSIAIRIITNLTVTDGNHLFVLGHNSIDADPLMRGMLIAAFVLGAAFGLAWLSNQGFLGPFMATFGTAILFFLVIANFDSLPGPVPVRAFLLGIVLLPMATVPLASFANDAWAKVKVWKQR